VSASKISVDLGENVNYTCKSYSVKPVRWYFEITHWHPVSDPIHYGSTYTIEHVKLEDAGKYFCCGVYYRTTENYLSEVVLEVYSKNKVQSTTSKIYSSLFLTY